MSSVPSHTQTGLSQDILKQLERFSNKQPYTSPTRWFSSSLRMKPTDRKHINEMPKAHIGLCWGGSALREGMSRQILAANPQDVLSIAADAYLLAKRQRTENILWTLSKIPPSPFLIFPLEGALNAHQAKKLAKSILREKNVDLRLLRQVNFLKMSTATNQEVTPLRHGLTLKGGILPRNTEKTRSHLYSILPKQAHPTLKTILEDVKNYIERTLKTSNSVENAVITEKGWQKIIRLFFIPKT